MAKSDETRKRIVEAAARLVRDKGVSALTQPAVARRAGVTQGHLTYYFPRRGDLLTALAQQSVDESLADLEEAARGLPRELDARLPELLSRLARSEPRTRAWVALFTLAAEEPAMTKVLRKALAQGRETIPKVLGVRLDDSAVALLQAIVLGAGLQQAAAPDPEALRAMLKRAVELLPRDKRRG